MADFVPICSGCQSEIQQGQKFVAKKDANGKWEAKHEGCVDLGSDFDALPKFFLTPARAWVLSK